METPSETRKRKRPPTFQHFPIQRAKKLKQTWVETVKIKSKWKAEKRKAGITETVRPPWRSKEDKVRRDEDEDEDGKEDVSVEGGNSAQLSDSKRDEEKSEDEDEVNEVKPPSSTPALSAHSKRQKSIPASRPQSHRKRHSDSRNDSHRPSAISRGKQREEPFSSAPDGPPTSSLRDLKREAYSQSSLHNFKSDPLGRHRGRGQGVNKAGRGGRGYESGPGRGRGRGQPNMQLRMNVMLEKIKRDAGS